METNNNTEITAANTNNTNNTSPAEVTRKRERGNFTGRRMNSFEQLDPAQFPRKREDYVPMWAQEMKAQIDLLSQGQQKLTELSSHANDSAELIAAVADLKKLCEEQFLKIRRNQEHSHEVLLKKIIEEKDKLSKADNSDEVLDEIKRLDDHATQLFQQMLINHTRMHEAFLTDIYGMLQDAKSINISWWHPIQKLKELWAAHVKAAKQKKAEKLQQQLMQLRGELGNK